MEDKIIGILQTLADKLCTTVDHLWGVLVVQAKVAALTQGLETAVIGLITFLLWRLRTKMLVQKNRDHYGEYNIAVYLYLIAMSACVIVFGINLFVFIEVASKAILNPEYWALTQILHLVGK